jgi:hypothetical protein
MSQQAVDVKTGSHSTIVQVTKWRDLGGERGSGCAFKVHADEAELRRPSAIPKLELGNEDMRKQLPSELAEWLDEICAPCDR